MNGLDWVLIGLSFFCILRGLFRGAISQIFGIAGALGGFFIATYYYVALAEQLLQVFPKLGGAQQAVGFITLFVLTWFCVAVVGFWIARFLYRTGLGFLDRLFGGVLGLGKALILTSILILALNLFLPPKSDLLSKSMVAPFVRDGTRIISGFVPENLQSLFEEKQKELQRYRPRPKEHNTRPDPHGRREVRA